MMIEMASCDQYGSVFIGEKYVYRVIDKSREKNIKNIYKNIEVLIPDYIVETKICSADDAPVDLSTNNKLFLKHRRIEYISYPNEWCASMLKDSALFHIDLTLKLLEKEMYLKDAHPWNLLFDGNKFVFIDFTSIVDSKTLFDEDYLNANRKFKDCDKNKRLALLTKEIYERMFVPYFFLPLIGYEFGLRSLIHKRIDETTLNTEKSTIKLNELLKYKKLSRTYLKKLPVLLKNYYLFKNALRRLSSDHDLEKFFITIKKLIMNLHVGQKQSGYSAYYTEKGEDDEIKYSDDWNQKQKSVYIAINKPEINTVLDAACNTGWYSILAHNLGKKVVAFDIDDACIEILYKHVKNGDLDLLPLVINVTNPTEERYSLYDGKRILIKTEERLRADTVLALGILHHLTLGLGLSFEHVINKLSFLSNKQLVLEFIDIFDEKILNEPTFFPAFNNNQQIAENYKLDPLITCLNKYYSKVTKTPSYPSTRTILICEK